MHDPLTISESSPLVVGKLVVYPNRLQYGDVRCNLLDIEHIGWFWFSQTINFLNTQTARMTLHIKGVERPLTITRRTMYVTPKLVTAYNFIAQETFRARLERYTDQLEKRGEFAFGDCIFFSDGRIVSGGREFQLSEATFEPFRLRAKQKGLFAPRLSVDLSIDRDVIVSILTFISRNPRKPSELRSAARQRQQAHDAADPFVVDVFSMLARLASADGQVTPEEIAVMRHFAVNALGMPRNKTAFVDSIIHAAQESPHPFEHFARNVHRAHRNNPQLLQNILDLLFSIAAADDTLSAEEELLLVQADEIFGISGSAFASFRADRERRRRATRAEAANREHESLRTLGLGIGAPPGDIKARYRRLVMQYHPDRVQHLGQQLRDEAERKIKDINVAYDFLAQRYAL